MTNHCAAPRGISDPAARNAWGVDLNRNNGEYSLFDGYFGASTSCTSDVYAGPSRVLRAGDQERAVGRGHVPEHQVREQHPLLRRLLHVGAGLVQVDAGRVTAPGAEHRHREVLLRGRREDPRPHQGAPQHGHPARAHGPDRRRALLGRRQLGGRPVVPQGHHLLLVRDRRRPLHLHPTTGTHADHDRLPALLRRAWAPAAAPARCNANLDQRGPRPGDGVRRRQLRHGRVRVRLRDGHDGAETSIESRPRRRAATRSTSSSTGTTRRRSSTTRPTARRRPSRRRSTTTSAPARSARC